MGIPLRVWAAPTRVRQTAGRFLLLFDEAVRIARPPKEVFALLTDVQDHAVQPGSSVLLMEKIPPGPTAVGTRWREVIRLGLGLTMTMWSEVTAVSENRMLAERFWGSGMRGTLVYTISADDGGCLLRQKETMEAVGWLRPFTGVLGAALRPRLHARLKSIRRHLEA
jgi:hypothetical protein